MSADNGDAHDLLRRVPRVDAILDDAGLASFVSTRGREFVLHHVRDTLDHLRQAIRRGALTTPEALPKIDALARDVARRIARDGEPLPRILNGTGVILHSGLGRAPMAPEATAAVARAAGYSLLEVDRDAGERTSRDTRIGNILRHLTGAEASLVVNNNAAATLLILRTLAHGRDVICSRGEMVEIGGSFRIPEVMEASGCRLVSVGATNKTHLHDYERAITAETAALLVVHTSNYRIVGFTASPALSAVAEVAHARGIPLIHDLGSGSLLSEEELGIGDEPPVQRSLDAGADVVCMSGDKLLGGPQAGIILGRRELVDRMRKDPLARALRIDKMTVAALEATLGLFLDRPRIRERHPVTRMLTATPESLRPRAEACARRIRDGVPAGVDVAVVPTTSEAGSGALPAQTIDSVAVAIASSAITPDALAKVLRYQTPGLFTRIHGGRILLDLRTLLPGEEMEAADLIIRVLETQP
jgi:L-seryl-tRNA(Ser) seleniumtransferase